MLQDIPVTRLAAPILEDYAYVARRMREDERAQFCAFAGLEKYQPDVAARAYAATPGPQFVFIDPQGYPAVIAGFEPVRPGVFGAWQSSTADAWGTHWRTITKITRRTIDRMLANGAHRIQIAALATRIEAHEWYERGLGMRREGVLRAYGADGSDAVMFAKTREG